MARVWIPNATGERAQNSNGWRDKWTRHGRRVWSIHRRPASHQLREASRFELERGERRGVRRYALDTNGMRLPCAGSNRLPLSADMKKAQRANR